MTVQQFGFLDWRVVGDGCEPSDSRRSEQEARILMGVLLLRNPMHS